MNTADPQVLPAPPSLIKSLMAGFDAISNHIGLILFSLALDLLLWLGPHVRLVALVESLFGRAARLPEMQAAEIAEMMRAGREQWMQIAEHFNLLGILRTFPVGVPSLMLSRAPATTPAGTAPVWEIDSLLVTMGLGLVLVLVGLLAGTLYFAVVAQAALDGKVAWRSALQSWPRTYGQVLLLALFWLVLLLVMTVPFSCVFSFLLIGGMDLGRFALLLYGGLLIWLLLPLAFSPHGIFVNQHTMWNSVREGARLVRVTLPTTGLLLLVILVLSEGLDVLWRVPPEDSWLVIVGIAGHAFVTAGLLAGSFVYYRDADHWLQKMIQQARLAPLKGMVRK